MPRVGARRAVALAALLLGALAASCADEVRPQLVVVVASDLRVPQELDEVRVRVLGPLASRASDERYVLSGPASVPLPFSFGVAPSGGDASRRVTVEVDAVLDDRVLFTVRRRPNFVDGEVRRLVIFLAARCIDGAASCEAGTTCELEGCLPEVVDGHSLPGYAPDAPLPDAGARPDGSVLDASEPDLGPEDTGPRDAGPMDTGPMDAGPRDAGPPDAGPDARPMDAGPRDAGPDVRIPDAGPDVRDLGADVRDLGPDVRDLGADAGDAGPDDDAAMDAGDASADDAGDAGPGPDAAMDAGDAGPADAGVCMESPCRVLLPQCGCPGALGCTFDADGGAECRALGTQGDGVACNVDPLACAPGYACIHFGADPFSRCRRLCLTSSSCPLPAACLPITDRPGFGSCQTFCDPTNAGACEPGLGCAVGNLMVLEGGTVLGAACIPVGTQGIGGACSTTECAAGLTCVSTGGGAPTCRPWCRRGGAPCAAGTGTCLPLTPAAIVGGIEYGICAMP